MRRSFFILLILSFSGQVFSQHVSLSDTIQLNEVTTYAPLKKYQAGAKIESISNDQMTIGQSGSIDQLLMRFTPIYLKSNAGGLSTCLLYTSDAADEEDSVDLGGRR